MVHSLEGKCALVTGGSRGIGRVIALAMASSGANVVVGYLNNENLATEVVSAITAKGRKAAAIKADLARRVDVVHLFDEAERSVGSLDIVVANAADILVKPLVDCTEEDYDRVFNTNTKGVFFTLQEAARRLRDNGSIIVVSTGGTKLFFPDQSLYLGSKGAVEQFVRCLSWELGPRNVTVNAISPGPTETDMMQERYRDRAAAMSPFHRLGDPKDTIRSRSSRLSGIGRSGPSTIFSSESDKSIWWTALRGCSAAASLRSRRRQRWARWLSVSVQYLRS